MPVSLLIFVACKYVLRRQKREFVVHGKGKNRLGGLHGAFSAKPSQSALPQLVILGLRQELFGDLELSRLL